MYKVYRLEFSKNIFPEISPEIFKSYFFLVFTLWLKLQLNHSAESRERIGLKTLKRSANGVKKSSGLFST